MFVIAWCILAFRQINIAKGFLDILQMYTDILWYIFSILKLWHYYRQSTIIDIIYGAWDHGRSVTIASEVDWKVWTCSCCQRQIACSLAVYQWYLEGHWGQMAWGWYHCNLLSPSTGFEARFLFKEKEKMETLRLVGNCADKTVPLQTLSVWFTAISESLFSLLSFSYSLKKGKEKRVAIGKTAYEVCLPWFLTLGHTGDGIV